MPPQKNPNALPPHFFCCIDCTVIFCSYDEAWLHFYDVHEAETPEDEIRVLLCADDATESAACLLPEAARRHAQALTLAPALVPAPAATSLPEPQALVLRPTPITFRVVLYHPADFLVVPGTCEFLGNVYTFVTVLPVTASAIPTMILEVVRIGFEASWGASAPQMRWKEWSDVRFQMIVGENSWMIEGNVEHLVPTDETRLMVEVGVYSPTRLLRENN